MCLAKPRLFTYTLSLLCCRRDDYHDRMAEQIELEQDASLLEEREQQMRQLEVGVASMPMLTLIVLMLGI